MTVSDSVLTAVVVVIAAAVVTQSVVLVALYFSFRRLSEQVDRFMKETRELMGPLKAITENLRAASASFVEMGITAREQFHRVEAMIGDTGSSLRLQLDRLDQMTSDISDRIRETAGMVQSAMLRPVREVAAIAKGVGRGIGAFFSRKKPDTTDRTFEREQGRRQANRQGHPEDEREDEELFI